MKEVVAKLCYSAVRCCCKIHPAVINRDCLVFVYCSCASRLS